MGLLSNFFSRRREVVVAESKAPVANDPRLGVANEYEAYDSIDDIAWRLLDRDVRPLLVSPQRHIHALFGLARYYREADPIVHGIIYNVYVPYITSSPWSLEGNAKTTRIYEAYYNKIRLNERLKNIATELVTYNNVVTYCLHGVPITMPLNRCEIGALKVNGEPLVNFDCAALLQEFRNSGMNVYRGWVKDNDPATFYQAYPEEVVEALNNCQTSVQLNPKYTKVLQGPKDGWAKWSVPFITSALLALQQKEMIRKYESAILNLGIHSVTHVKYGGDLKDHTYVPAEKELSDVHQNFKKAMSRFPLVTTNQFASAQVVQPDMDDLFQWDKYRQVNNDILSAGGVSGVIVTGVAEDGATFASAQVSMQTAEARIEAYRVLICELVNKLNECIKEELEKTHIYNVRLLPLFSFMPLEMSGRKAMREACTQLWRDGVVSTETLLRAHGYDLEHEIELRQHEQDIDLDQLFTPHGQQVSTDSEEDEGGRPVMTDEERHSDPESSESGAQPKPSTA